MADRLSEIYDKPSLATHGEIACMAKVLLELSDTIRPGDIMAVSGNFEFSRYKVRVNFKHVEQMHAFHRAIIGMLETTRVMRDG